MDTWTQIDANCWCKESDLPIGRAIAEIRKQGELSLYTARVEVVFGAHHLPENMSKSTSGLQSQAEAQNRCNALLAECVAAEALSQMPCSQVDSTAWFQV